MIGNCKFKVVISLMLTFAFLFPLGVAQAAPAEGYDLRGWDKDQEKWSPGNLSGYSELDWVPFSLTVKNYQGNATEICFQHDNEKLGVMGYSKSDDFYIGDSSGDVLFTLRDGVFSVSGPEYRSESGGVQIMEYCFHIFDPQALIDLNQDFTFYWETQIAGPNEASRWSGASLHTTTSVTGAQTVPISVQKITPLLSPGLELNKIASESFANPGDSIIYTFEVTNTGDYDLSDVIVSDDLFGADWSYSVGSLAIGENISFDVPFIFPEDTKPGTFLNTATATGAYSEGSVSASDGETVLIQSVTSDNPSIDIHKNVNAVTAAPGDDVTYSIHVTNTGNVDLEDVMVTDPLFGSSWSYMIPLLHAGQIETFEVPYTVPLNTAAGLLENTVLVNATSSSGPVTDSASMSLIIETENPPNPYTGVELVKGVDSETANPGDTITYFFIVRNIGTYGLTNVAVVDPLFGESWSYLVGDLAPGASVTFEQEYNLAGDALPGIIENTATVSAVYSGGTVTDTASETVSIVMPPSEEQASIQVDKVASVENVNPGDTIIYTIQITNNGSVDLTNVIAEDHLMGVGWSHQFGDLQVGQTKQFTYSYLVPLGTAAGKLINTVNVSGSHSGGIITATDSETVFIDAPPSAIANLILNSVCSADPEQTRKWRITNTNHIDIPFTWQLLESGETGSSIISGDSDLFLETQTVANDNTLKIVYLDDREEIRLSSGQKCESGTMELITLHSMCVASPDSNLIEWQVYNPNDFSVEATWTLEEQSGSITITPGIAVFYTEKVPNSANTLTLYINNEKYAVESRACYQDIILTAECSNNPAQSLRWKLTNHNFYPVEVEWVLLDSLPLQTGNILVQPGDNYFYTNTLSGDNIVAIFVDEILQRNGTVLSGKVKCPGSHNEDEDEDDGTIKGTIIELDDIIDPAIPGGPVLIDDVIKPIESVTPIVPEQLPATGGGSAWNYYLIGALLVLGGVLLLKKAAASSKK